MSGGLENYWEGDDMEVEKNKVPPVMSVINFKIVKEIPKSIIHFNKEEYEKLSEGERWNILISFNIFVEQEMERIRATGEV